MQARTEAAFEYAKRELSAFLEYLVEDTADVSSEANLTKVAAHFHEASRMVDELQARMTSVQLHHRLLSSEIIPTMMMNQRTKSLTVTGVGRMTVIDRWSAKILDKVKAFAWLRSTGNEGLIRETVNAQTLGAFAKGEVIKGNPLPDDIFQVTASPYTSITAIRQ